jgi:hypothetical protein
VQYFDLRSLSGNIRLSAVLSLHLLNGLNLSSKPSELDKFLLYGLQPLMSLDISDLSVWVIPVSSSVCLIQRLNMGDLAPELRNFVSKSF